MTQPRQNKSKREKIEAYNQLCTEGPKKFQELLENITREYEALSELSWLVAINKSKGTLTFTSEEGVLYPTTRPTLTVLKRQLKSQAKVLRRYYQVANKPPKVFHYPWEIFSNNPAMYLGDALTYFFFGPSNFGGPAAAPNFGLLNPHARIGETIEVPAEYRELIGSATIKNDYLLTFLTALRRQCASKGTILALYYRYPKINTRVVGDKRTSINMDDHMRDAFDLLPATFVNDEMGKKVYQGFYTKWSGRGPNDKATFHYTGTDDGSEMDVEATRERDGKYYAVLFKTNGPNYRVPMLTSLDVIIQTRERNIRIDQQKQAQKGAISKKEPVDRNNLKMTDIQSATQRNAFTEKELTEFGWDQQLQLLQSTITDGSIERDNIYVQLAKYFDRPVE